MAIVASVDPAQVSDEAGQQNGLAGSRVAIQEHIPRLEVNLDRRAVEEHADGQALNRYIVIYQVRISAGRIR